MPETGNSIGLNCTFRSIAEHQEVPKGCNLLVYLDPCEFSIALTGWQSRKLLALETWNFYPGLVDEASDLQKVLQESQIAAAKGYRNVVFISGLHPAVLVPDALYDPRDSLNQLKFAMDPGSGFQPGSDKLTHLDAVNVYPLPDWFRTWMVAQFPEANLVHATTPVIEQLITTNKQLKEDVMTVCVNQQHADILVTSGKALKLVNRYTYQAPDELLYYMLVVMEQLNLNPDHLLVYFAGNLTEGHPFIQLAQKYIRHTGWAQLPESFADSALFLDQPPHRYFNLLCGLHCVS